MKTQEKTIIIIAHLSMFLARTGFGLLVPLIIYLNSNPLFSKQLKETALDTLKFQAKITFSFLGLQFLGIIYQIATSFISSPELTQLNFSPYNPLTVISLASQVILTAGVVFAVFASLITLRGKNFRYPSLWFAKSS